MDLSRVYTKTSKGILEGSAKARGLTREHARVLALIDGQSTVRILLEKNPRISENNLASILDALTNAGMIRQLSGAQAGDDLGFSSTIIVADANTQAFFEAQARVDYEQQQTEDAAAQLKQQAHDALLAEVQADIQAETDAIKRDTEASNTQAAHAAAVRDAARGQREAEAKLQADALAKEAEDRARKQLATEATAREEAEARAKALEAEMFMREEALRQAKQEAAERALSARIEAEKKARELVEKQAAAAEKAREEAARKASKQIELAARLAREMEEKAMMRRALEAKIQSEEEAQRRADMDSRIRQIEQDKRRAQEEAQALAQNEARVAKELDSRVKRRIEARAREQEAAQLRAEAEARTKLEEAEKLQQAAQARAQEEAEARRLAEAAALKAEQETQARLEAERLAHQEAEARAMVEAEAQRQAEVARLEAARREEEARLAREAIENETRARVEAKAQAEAEQRKIEEVVAQAAEQARQEAERREEQARITREAAAQKVLEAAALRAREAAEQEAREAQARAAQVEAARLEAEARARAVAEAEEAIRLEAAAVKQQLEDERREEETRLESEALARKQAAERASAEEAAEKSRALAEARERAEAAARARDDERRQARELADTTARIEAEEALRRHEAVTLQEEAEEDRLRAEAQARAMAASQGDSIFPFLAQQTPVRPRIRLDKNLIKPTLLILLGLSAMMLVAAHLVSFNFYIPTLEQALHSALGQRVVVKDIRFSIYPAPHLKLEGVLIGDLGDVRISNARLFPAFSSWFADEKTMHRVELDTVLLSEASVGALAVWSKQQANAVPMHFEKVLLKDVKLTSRLFDLPAFNAEVKLDHGRFFQAQIRSADQRMTIDISPQAEGVAIKLAGTSIALPLEPRLQFDDLKISASARPGGMTISQIEGQFYGGSLSGNAQVSWREGWAFTSDLGVRQVAIESVLPLFTHNVKTSGALEAKIRFTSKSAALENLFDAPQVQATFRLRDGELSGVDLVRAIQSARSSGSSGGKTHFNELSGYFQLSNNRYQFRQLKLATGVLNATGNVDFSSERNLSGNVAGELRTRSTSLRTGFVLGGTLETPMLKLAGSTQRALPEKVEPDPLQQDQ